MYQNAQYTDARGGTFKIINANNPGTMQRNLIFSIKCSILSSLDIDILALLDPVPDATYDSNHGECLGLSGRHTWGDYRVNRRVDRLSWPTSPPGHGWLNYPQPDTFYFSSLRTRVASSSRSRLGFECPVYERHVWIRFGVDLVESDPRSTGNGM
jgi:hypothetical protein